jgi:cold shock CspA family protein
MKTVHGVVVEFARGGVEWGFLRGDRAVKDTYVHRKALRDGTHSLTRGERCEWVETLSDRGLRADDVHLEEKPMQELDVADRSEKGNTR